MTKISTDPPAFRVRPAQPEEAGAFFAQTPEQNAQMGAIGCVRMDFGKRGTAFWHTWHPRGREELNSPEFRAELQQVVDTLRETVLKDLSSMRHFCYENGGKIPGGWSQNYGYVVETEHYECEFLEAVAAECGPAEAEHRDMTLDEVLREFTVAVPDWAREKAGITADTKLDCEASEDAGVIAVYPASYRHDLTDVPRSILQCLLASGHSLYALNDILTAESENSDAE